MREPTKNKQDTLEESEFLIIKLIEKWLRVWLYWK